MSTGVHEGSEPTGGGETITRDELFAAQRGVRPRSSAPFVPGKHVGMIAGSLKLERILGHGGGGCVYEARHLLEDRRLAVKVLGEDWIESPTSLRRFQREIAVCRTIKHPNILPIFDAGHLSDGAPFYSMELLDGEDLERVLHRAIRLAPDECVRIFEAVGSALHSAHCHGVTHRDLKASNVFILHDGTIKLLDFGVAHVAEQQGPGLTARGHHVGTPTYMAPEQILCFPAESRSDIYAAGVLLFRMLTGEYPFNGKTREELLQAHLIAPIPRPSDIAPIPRAFDAIIGRCLQKRTEDRYQTVAELQEALRRALPHDGVVTVSRPAWALYVNAFSDPVDEDRLEAWVAHLGAQGFAPTLETSEGTLMVLACDDSDVRMQLRRILRVLHDGGVWNGLRIVLHRAPGLFAGDDFRGGPVLELPTWIQRAPLSPGVVMTESAAECFE